MLTEKIVHPFVFRKDFIIIALAFIKTDSWEKATRKRKKEKSSETHTVIPVERS